MSRPNKHRKLTINERLPHRAWQTLLGCLLAIVMAFSSANAQVPEALNPSQAPTAASKQKEKRTLEQWREEIKERLAAVNDEIQRAEKEAGTSSSSTTRRFKALTRIDLLLTQLVGEQSKAIKLDEDRQQLQKSLDQLIQQGLDEDADTSFRRLDQVREDLRVEKRRLKRATEKEDAATAALETAQAEAKERSSARRQAKEKSEDNADDKLRQGLGEKLAEAIEQSEVADALLQLREQELLNAKNAKALQELKVRIADETENRLQAVVKFGPEELDNLFAELDQKESELENRLANFEGAAEPRIRYVEEQWISARRKLDTATEENEAELKARVKAFELEYQTLRAVPSLLRLQIDRLSEDRKVWRARQRVFQSRPDAKTVVKWTKDSNEALEKLRREERKVLFELDELKEQVQEAEARLRDAKEKSAEATAIEKQIESLRSLQSFHEENLNSIRTSEWLHERLLDELKSDSLAANAKDQLHNAWQAVQAVWNYELTKFGEGSDEKSVTVRKVVTALLILLAGMIFSKALSRALGRQVLRRLDIDPSASATIQSLFYYVLLLMFGLFALNVAKVPLTAFTVLGGAVALGIGFGSQNIINNFISGLILLAERPVKVGDLIQLEHASGEKLYGNIEHIGARSTRVRTGSNLEIIVPNSSFLQNNVVNFTLSSDKVRTKVEVGVIYGSPTVTVTQLLRRAVIETGRVAKDPPPIILFKNFGDNSLVFEVHFWLRMRTMMDQKQIESAVRFRIDQLFREEGIVIAFPQRDVHLNSVSPLEVRMVESPHDNGSVPL